MTRVLEYDNQYNTEHWKFWACKGKPYCNPGDIEGGMLVLSEDDGSGSRVLVDLQIVRKYEHNGEIYRVERTKSGKYKSIKI
jgi:hypothetical protein